MPGAFELGPLAARVARKGGIDGIVALGCLIRGGTEHYRVLCDEVGRALGALAMEGGTNPRPLAVAFGVLTCETLQQAQERADPRGADKGGEARWRASSRSMRCGPLERTEWDRGPKRANVPCRRCISST